MCVCVCEFVVSVLKRKCIFTFKPTSFTTTLCFDVSSKLKALTVLDCLSLLPARTVENSNSTKKRKFQYEFQIPIPYLEIR